VSRNLGWIDTNIFIHALFRNDPHYRSCRAIIDALEAGEAECWIDPLVVHELTYVLLRQSQFASRGEVHQFIQNLLLCDAVLAQDKNLLIDALARWATEGVSFADAWLYVLARRRGMPICSVHRADFPNLENTFLQVEA
jgi:predicted nucleic acid-binding protein